MNLLHRPIPAVTARTLGMALLRRAIDVCGQMTLSSYDRLFPARDLLPTNAKGNARFGNLIGLPLQGVSRLKGTTVFCDPQTWEPHPDQFSQLSQVERLSSAQVEALVDKLGEVKAGPSATAPVLPPKPRRRALGLGRQGPSRRCSRSPPRACRQPCLPHSSTRRRSTTRSSTAARASGTPPGTPRAWSAPSTPPTRTGSGCRAACATKRPSSSPPPAAHSRSPASLRTPR
ncbi:TOTE conflict system archaeo-eukaryotic primase domain-containing protein [Streptomyces sp. AC1-42T]|uniref:TOTE conflict system archaeo-eukaryotic primase domain-containing protein n=1 Tax=unclassified Streptomyces TaxID=2593676 RepID=UPI00406D2442